MKKKKKKRKERQEEKGEKGREREITTTRKEENLQDEKEKNTGARDSFRTGAKK